MIGQTISHYLILEKIGEGGMGIVYKAKDLSLKRPVALKFLPQQLADDDQAREKFSWEAKAASALDHPNICTIHEINRTADGQIFMVMTYYEGQTLKEKLDTGKLPFEEAIGIAVQIAQGLHKAHTDNIIHRDIKPANIFITKDGIVKILDFGLAYLSESDAPASESETAGTLAYMSPEQIQGHHVDNRTDIWSFGVVLYEMLSGKPPFSAPYSEALIYDICYEQPEPIKINASAIEENNTNVIVHKCLEKRIDSRYQTLRDVIEDVNNASVVSKSIGADTNFNKIRSRKLFTRITIFALFIIVTGLLYTLSGYRLLLNRGKIPSSKHLAVLPFMNVGNDQASQIFADGLVECLSSRLSQLEKFQGTLFVVPTSDVRKQKVQSAAEAKRIFEVTMVVTGSVQRAAPILRLTLNLVDTKHLRQIRSVLIDGTIGDVLALQDSALSRLANILEIELLPDNLRILNEGFSSIPQVNDFYVQSRGYLQQYQKNDNLQNAIKLLQQAVKRDPDFVLAFAGLAEAYLRLYEADKDLKWLELSKENCNRALELNDHLAPVYIIDGLISLKSGNSSKAITEFQHALRINDKDPEALRGLAKAFKMVGNSEKTEMALKQAIDCHPSYWAGYNELGIFYSETGRYSDAISQFQRIVELTPDNPVGYRNLGSVNFFVKQFDYAIENLQKSIALQPDYRTYSNLATIYFYKGLYSNAIKNYQQALALSDNDYRVWGQLAESYYWAKGDNSKTINAYRTAAQKAELQLKLNPEDPDALSNLADYSAALSDTTKAHEYLHKVIDLAPVNLEIIFRIGQIHERLGEREEALKWIGEASKKGYSTTEIALYPGLRGLVNDKRFQELLAKTQKQD